MLSEAKSRFSGKKTILAMTGILVLGWAVAKGQTSTDTATTEQVQIEEYVPKVIIEGKWGTETGEFGIQRDLREGDLVEDKPNSIAVDSKGNIYILDVVNNRIQKFNNDGKYLLSIPVDSFKGTTRIEKEGISADPRKQTIKPEDIKWIDKVYISATGAKGINIVIDSQDNLYYYLVRQKANKGEVWQFKDDKLVRKWEVPAVNYHYLNSVMIQDGQIYVHDYNKKKNIVIKDKIIDRNYRKSEKLEPTKEGKYQLIDTTENIKMTFDFPKGKYFKVYKAYYRERKGKEVITIDVLENVNGAKKGKYYNYDKKGKLISISPVNPLVYYNIMDKERNAYFLDTTETGIKVIKYVLE